MGVRIDDSRVVISTWVGALGCIGKTIVHRCKFPTRPVLRVEGEMGRQVIW